MPSQKIYYSHEGWSSKKIEALRDFFVNVKKMNKEDAMNQVDFMEWYKKEFSTICFEAVAWDNGKAVGYMRCYNDPDKKTRWLVGDINVISEYRKRHIATKLYEKVIEELKEYEMAEYVEASIDEDNQPSIGLHEKLGFKDTKKQKSFANFYFNEKETFYKLVLYKYLPLPDSKESREMLEELCSKYKKIDINKIYDNGVIKDNIELYSIWNGNKLAGLYVDGEEIIDRKLFNL